jgi:hypothetical protein
VKGRVSSRTSIVPIVGKPALFSDPGARVEDEMLPIDGQVVPTRGGFPDAVLVIVHVETRPYSIHAWQRSLKRLEDGCASTLSG